MTTKGKNKTKTAKVAIQGKPGESKEDALSRARLDPTITAASTAFIYSQHFGEGASLAGISIGLLDATKAVHAGDLRGAESMLTAQAAALNSIFTELARRASLNMGEYLGATETYMKLALRAQNQARMTLETLATIKNPPVVFAKQANIAHGHQQVNNGDAVPVARAGETEVVSPDVV